MQQIDDERIIQPLTPKIVEEADKETSRQLKYFREHQEELDKMTMDERFAAMMKAAKED